MTHPRFAGSRVLFAGLLAGGLALTACSSGSPASTSSSLTPTSSSSASPSPSPSSAATAEPVSGPGAIQAITTNWTTFFDAKTPIARRLALLQDGSQFAAVIRAQAHSPLALAATSKVDHVTLSGTKQAYVTYAIVVGGTPQLSGQQGVAVYQNGVWKVGVVSFCGLLKLENGGKTSGLPAGCKG